MQNFETQTNQIHLTDITGKSPALMVFEEQLRNPLRLFSILFLSGAQKKSDMVLLGKIAQIIISNLKQNEKSSSSQIMELSMQRINSQIADLALKNKTLPKRLSAIIGLKTENELFVTNTGNTSCWVLRGQKLSQVTGPQPEHDSLNSLFTHVLNGKIKDADRVVFATSNTFNYVSISLLGEILKSNNLDSASAKISDIIREFSASNSFGLTLVDLRKIDESAIAENDQPSPYITPSEPVKPAVYAEEDIYAPIPKREETKKPLISLSLKGGGVMRFLENVKRFKFKPSLPSFKFSWFSHLSRSSKFFLIAFLLVIITLTTNIINWGVKNSQKKAEEQLAGKIEKINSLLTEAESALLYKNDEQAFRIMLQAKEEIGGIKNADEKTLNLVTSSFNVMSERVNRIVDISNPKIIAEFNFIPISISKAGNNFIITGENTDNYGVIKDGQYSPVFMLNKNKNRIITLSHVPNVGNWLITSREVLLANEQKKELDTVVKYDNYEIIAAEVYNNRLYLADSSSAQVLRAQIKNSSPSAMQSAVSGIENSGKIADMGIDTDIWLLYPDGIKKYSNGKRQQFSLPQLTDPVEDAKKIFVGNNLYVLEPAKKRLLIISKSGKLINQLYFKNSNNLSDFYVDETQRAMQVIDGNKLEEITF